LKFVSVHIQSDTIVMTDQAMIHLEGYQRLFRVGQQLVICCILLSKKG